MSVVRAQVRRGAYYDSLVLMQLERELAARPGVEAAGVVMGTAANRPLLAANGLLTAEAEAAAADDLVVVVRAASDDAAATALARGGRPARPPRRRRRGGLPAAQPRRAPPASSPTPAGC